MQEKILRYNEITPDDGKMLFNGKILTSYVCELITDDYENKWNEIDIEKEDDENNENELS